MLLWRTGSYQFRVLEYKGEPAELLTNYDYILIERRYEGALRSAGAHLQLMPVIIRDEYRKRVWRNYLEVTMLRTTSAAEIWHASPAGPAIYRAGESNVFVSTTLKEILEQVQGHSFRFSWGLSLFA
jgi:hypothetical protein